MRISHSLRSLIITFSAISVAHGAAHAGGFGLDEQGAAAMGRANAFVAQADDPTALFYNPAGIGQLHGTQISFGATLITPATTFKNRSSNNMTDTVAALFYPPTLYLSHEMRPGVHVGMGVFTPFGLSTEWPSDWEGRYVTTFSAINTYYLNPNITWSPNSRFHIAAGVSYVPSSVTLRNKLELTPSPDGELEIEAEGEGWGYNLALLTSLTLKNSVGISFRGPVTIDYTGDATFSPSAVLGPPQAIRSSLTMPPILTVGLANHALEAITLEADVQWVGWSKIKDIAIDFVDPSLTDAVSTKNWRDSYSFRLGAELSRNPLSFRAGYAYDMTPIPSDTIDPSLADANKHTFAIGGGYRFGKATIDAAYMFIKSNNRGVDTTIATGGTPFVQQGKYSTQTHELGIGVVYRF